MGREKGKEKGNKKFGTVNRKKKNKTKQNKQTKTKTGPNFASSACGKLKKKSFFLSKLRPIKLI